MVDSRNLLTTTEFAELCGVAKATIHYYVREGWIRPAQRSKGRGEGLLWDPNEASLVLERRSNAKAGASARLTAPRIPATPATPPTPRISPNLRLVRPAPVMPPNAAMSATPTARQVSPELSAYTAEQARDCFKHFAGGGTLRGAVIELGFHPDVVAAIWKTYQQMTDQAAGVFVSRETLSRIARLPLDGPIPVHSEADLEEVLRATSESSEKVRSCKSCGQRRSTVCATCAGASSPEPPPQEGEPEASPVEVDDVALPEDEDPAVLVDAREVLSQADLQPGDQRRDRHVTPQEEQDASA